MLYALCSLFVSSHSPPLFSCRFPRHFFTGHEATGETTCDEECTKKRSDIRSGSVACLRKKSINTCEGDFWAFKKKISSNMKKLLQTDSHNEREEDGRSRNFSSVDPSSSPPSVKNTDADAGEIRSNCNRVKDEKMLLLFELMPVLKNLQLHIELSKEGAARLLLFGTETILRLRLFICVQSRR